MSINNQRFRRMLYAAAGGTVLAGLGVLWYANRVGARRYRLERLKVKTHGGTGGDRAAAGTGSIVTEAFSVGLKEPQYAGEPGTARSAGGGKFAAGGNGHKQAAARLHVAGERAQTYSSKGEPVRLRILHLSDTHLCAPDAHTTGRVEFLKRVTDDDYDLIVITGDIFENETGLQYAQNIISRKPRLGAVAVLGNHDYYAYTWFNKTVGRLNRKYRHPPCKRDVQPFIDALAANGVLVLRNSAITYPEERLHVVGIDYPGTTQEQLSQLVSTAPDHFLNLALLHLPRRLHQLPQSGVHLAFAGHTHGGQVRLPGIGALITDSELPRHEASGLVYRGRTTIHVSRGLGADPKTNIRLFCPPAATLLEVEHHS